MTPSKPAPSKRCEPVRRPRRGRSVSGVRWTCGSVAGQDLLEQPPPFAERLADRSRRRGPAGRRRRTTRGSPPPAGRPATRPGAAAAAARRSRGRRRRTTTSSPSTTQRSGSAARSGVEHLREVAGQGPVVAAAELDLVAVAEHDAAEAVPLRLVEQPGVARHLVDRLGQHGPDGRHHGQAHPGEGQPPARVPSVVVRNRGPAAARPRPGLDQSGRDVDRRAERQASPRPVGRCLVGEADAAVADVGADGRGSLVPWMPTPRRRR